MLRQILRGFLLILLPFGVIAPLYAQDDFERITPTEELPMAETFPMEEEVEIDHGLTTQPTAPADFVMPNVNIPNDVSRAMNACVTFGAQNGLANPMPNCACSTGYMAALMTPLEFHVFTEIVKDGYAPEIISANVSHLKSKGHTTDDMLKAINNKMVAFGKMADRVCGEL